MSYARSSHEPGASPEGDLSAPDRDLAGTLHEVSNALTVVLGWLEEARAASNGNRRLERALDIAFSRALVGRDLARRAIGGRAPLKDEEIRLGSLVRDAARGVEREAERRDVTLSARALPEAGGICVRDGGAALQILTNLLLNSIAMGSETVHLEARLGANQARLSVIDDGPGIEAERRATIFEGGESRRPGGAGLGLRHAYALAEAKGGKLRLVPSSRGAHFELSWPIAGPPHSGTTRSRAGSLLAGRRIAILDDDPVVLDLLATALEARSASALTARTLDELDSIAREGFDAALLDLSPIAHELAPFLRRLGGQNPESPIILISGASGGLPGEAEGLASAWVRKPFELSEVLTTLDDVLQTRLSAKA